MFIILGTDGKEYGPVTLGNVVEWMRDGRANLQTRVKLASDGEWKTLGDFAEFGGQAKQAPARPAVLSTAPMTADSVAPMRPAGYSAAPAMSGAETDSASLIQRLLAALVDGIIKTLCYLPITIPLFRLMLEQARAGEQPSFVEMTRLTKGIFDANFGQALPLFVLLVAVQAGLLAWRSQSVGKLLLGIRIVRSSDNSPAGFRHAFLLRSAVPFIIEQIPLVGLFFWFVDSCFIFRDDRRCLHDLLADTRVVPT